VGGVRFSCPVDLVRSLAAAGGIDAAVETGTFRAEGTVALREAVPRVWSIELSEDRHRRAEVRHGQREGITFLQGSSGVVLPELLSTLDEPVLFWLDAHGGMVDLLSNQVYNPADTGSQCPLVAELRAVRRYPHAARSCVLIDDARAFLGPLRGRRAGDWPALLEVLDLVRHDTDPYVTILDDVIISVPSDLRTVVDQWWLDQADQREGRDGHEQNLWDAYNPSPKVAVRRLVKSVTPVAVRRVYDRYR